MEVYAKILHLRNGNEEEKKEAISSIPEIAKALGAKRTAHELIPYIGETPNYNEKDWLSIIDQISQIDIKNYPDDEQRMIIENFCYITKLDSKQIREKIADRIRFLINKLSKDAVQELMFNIIVGLSKTVAYPTVRAAAISIFSKNIDVLTDDTINTIFTELEPLSHDSSAFVRQTFAASARNMIRNLSPENASVLGDIILKLSEDRSFSVVNEIPMFLPVYVESVKDLDMVIKIGHNLSLYKNWRVRCNFLNHIKEIFDGTGVNPQEIYAYVATGIHDNDEEVRAVAAEIIGYYASLKGAFEQSARDLFEQVTNDKSNIVVAGATKSLPYFLSTSNDEFAMKQVQLLIQHPSKDVSYSALKSLKGANIPSNIIIDCINSLIKDGQWRDVEPLASLLPEIFSEPSEEVSQIFCRLLMDDVCAVRAAALNSIGLLTSRMGKSWSESTLLPRLKECFDTDDYQLRQTAAAAVVRAELYKNSDGRALIESAAGDEIANVRLIVAQEIRAVEELRPLREKLANDKDEDVREAILG